ncbi:MAG: arsenate reductase ArsC [Candidatus Thorarchaeota archaeon]|nr:arsenate reductase ArsC [Candidatus Thorarchaeota archaeon]MCK5239272.1 arsenate reductase ArsC [Candidatus Thorarchaeota archaeon]
MKRVLFLCTGNSARSQMSESLLRLLSSDDFEVVSAGTNISSEVNPFAIEALKERGAPIDGLHPKKVNQFTGDSFDLVITVCDNAKQECPHFPGAKKMLHWSLEDPAAFLGTYDKILTVFRETRDEIERLVRIHVIGE